MTARTRTKAAPRGAAATPAIFDATFPEIYAVAVRGVCLEPEWANGSIAIIDGQAKPEPGDYVVLHFKEGMQPPGCVPGQLKRLKGAVPPSLNLPLDSDAEVEPVIIVEALNPLSTLAIGASRLKALHLCLGRAELGPDGSAILTAEHNRFSRLRRSVRT